MVLYYFYIRFHLFEDKALWLQW